FLWWQRGPAAQVADLDLAERDVLRLAGDPDAERWIVGGEVARRRDAGAHRLELVVQRAGAQRPGGVGLLDAGARLEGARRVEQPQIGAQLAEPEPPRPGRRIGRGDRLALARRVAGILVGARLERQ